MPTRPPISDADHRRVQAELDAGLADRPWREAAAPVAAAPFCPAVFYRPEMTAPRQGFSPSAAKPGLFVAHLAAARPGRFALRGDFAPVSRDELLAVHAAAYVDGVLAGRVRNGFGTLDAAVAASLRYTSGSLLAAARHVLASGAPAALSPTSGFHHAHYERGHGFCTFNGLVLVARRLADEGRRVGILDFDAHAGDGTAALLGHSALGWAGRSVPHWSYGAEAGRGGGRRFDFDRFADMLPARFGDCDLVLYQAGADPHEDDPLGGDMTTAELRRRDDCVFRVLGAAGVPVVWNLAGGYQEPLTRVLDLHLQTFDAMLEVYGGGV